MPIMSFKNAGSYVSPARVISYASRMWDDPVAATKEVMRRTTGVKSSVDRTPVSYSSSETSKGFEKSFGFSRRGGPTNMWIYHSMFKQFGWDEEEEDDEEQDNREENSE